MIRIGIVGTGRMAGRHAKRFGAIRGVKLAACCDIDEGKAEEYAARYKIPSVWRDFRAMLREEKLDAVSIVTPDNAHGEVALEAAKRGLHIFCEKPLATDVPEGRRMLRAVERAGVLSFVNFSYRDSSALQRAAQLIGRGGIGRVLHVEASYLQSWLASRIWGDWRTSPALTWRLSTAHGSMGVLGDVGCHIYDAAAFLAGDIAEIYCRLGTFDKGVRGGRIGPYRLDANDSFTASVVFENGALGTVHSSRWATGHVNTVRVAVYGDRGAVEIDLDRSYDEFRLCRGRRAVDRCEWRTVKCARTPDCYERFVRAVRTGKPDPCDFRNALKIQAYLEASLKSDARKRPVPVAGR